MIFVTLPTLRVILTSQVLLHGGRGYKSCIGEGRAGVECEGVARGL